MRRTFEQHLDPDIGPKRILSLSGGGVRGLVTLGALAHLEAMIRAEFDDESLVLSDYYDLIAGNILQTLKVTPIVPGGFMAYMKSIGKLGGQNKVQRLANDRKVAEGLLGYKK